jgi:hypothetical protein
MMNKLGSPPLVVDDHKNSIAHIGPSSGNTDVRILDHRIARLLLILGSLDDSVAGLDLLPQAELAELVASAIEISGFASPFEAQFAIGAVLETIQAAGPPATS